MQWLIDTDTIVITYYRYGYKNANYDINLLVTIQVFDDGNTNQNPSKPEPPDDQTPGNK